MSQEDFVQHYVCTRDEGLKLLDPHQQFWVSNCGCREGRGECGQSRMDVCLLFNENFPPTGSGKREIDKNDVLEIFREAGDKHLVVRPFRKEENPHELDGICFCCNDCCYYFHHQDEKCDKGAFIETTDFESCTHCGECVDICYFNARVQVNEELILNRNNCYGCGLCIDVCPEDCIAMMDRS